MNSSASSHSSSRVNALLAEMTLDEKLGQMMQVDLSAIRDHMEDITAFGFGSILSGGDSDPASGNSALSWKTTHDSIQQYALRTRLKIPMLYGIDAVHGHNNVEGATLFPHNIGLGCTRNASLIEQAARVTAVEMAATGIRWTFSPCLAVARDERWGRTYEGFGETPELAEMGAVAVRGYQGESLSASTSVMACAKHFLGDGGTAEGTDRGDTKADEATIRRIHLPGYLRALKYGTGSIMVSFNSINGQQMHGSKYWLTDVLKQELGFTGFLVSDWGAVDLLGPDYAKDLETSINAGLDMVMLPLRYRDFLNAMQGLVRNGQIPLSRIDDAVRRILTAKLELGLFERPFADPSLLERVGCAEHRAFARECVRESLVLLKNHHVLPLSKSSRILVAGTHAHNLGYQCGGWTISWQGGSGNVTAGTTILEGIKEVAPDADILFSPAGEFGGVQADASVVVIGETPYAEWEGDRKDLSLPAEGVELVKRMKSYGAPVVVILISGRPLILGELLDYADTIIAAWLPGSEGTGVADLLFGDARPRGVLSHSWPASMADVPVNAGDPEYHPLFPYGFGLQAF